jgi:radical SAM superfamily enzyme YgiQ (UPF0313 family)
MDILLIHYPAPLEEEIADHVGIGYMASTLRQRGMKVRVVDGVIQQLSLQDVLKVIRDYFRKYHFCLLGLSIYQKNYKDLKGTLSILRSAGVNTHITVGGHFPTLAAKEVLLGIPALDSICRGEGEYTIAELATRLKQKKDWRDIPNLAYRGQNGEIIINLNFVQIS